MDYSFSMPGRTPFRLGFLALFISQFHLAPCLAQSNACSELAPDEAETLQGRNAIIDDVEFHGDNPFSESQWSATISQIKISPFGGPESIQDRDTLEYIATPIRGLLQDHGYFKAVVTPRVYFIRAEADTLHYVLSVTIQAGEQYHLTRMRFRAADPDHPELAFSESELRLQFESKDGDLLDVSKIRRALDALEKLYRSKGFIDMVPTPDTRIHEYGFRHDDPDAQDTLDAKVDSGVDLIIFIDEGKPYRISKIEVVGLPFVAVQQLQLPQVAGDVFNPNLWTDYFDKDAPPLPKGASQEKNMGFGVRNVKHHTISFAVDFRPCPSTPAIPITYSEVAPSESSVTTRDPAQTVRSLEALPGDSASSESKVPSPK
jgi:Surface antigen variable number repeat